MTSMGADEQLVPQVAHPGQRPVLFPSPYEVATWSVVPASGFADAWLGHPEHRGVDHAAGSGTIGTRSAGERAGRWRPFRTWALVLIRVAGDRGTTI
jgi:hypothetical protein